MKTKILIVIIILVCGYIAVADPNTPAPTQPIEVRLLTAEETLALQLNGTTLNQLVNRLLERELPRQVKRAKLKLSKELTLTQIQAIK